MSPVRLADTRKDDTLQDADQVLARIRELTCQKEVIVAKAEKKISDVTQAAVAKVEPIEEELAKLTERLTAFILTHKELFKKPRKRKTADGTYGLRHVSNLEITDQDAVLQHVLRRGLHDCLNIKRTLVKGELRKAIEEDLEIIQGCKVVTGQVASYDVNKALIEKAKADATQE